MEPKIIYEDEFILGLDKPSGLMVHSNGRSKERTLVDWIVKNYPEISEVGEEQILQTGEKIKRPGIVHRLDRETSGAILVAKTKEAHQFLKEQFQNRKVEKIYNAVVWGEFVEDKMSGTIDKAIGRSASDFRKWSAEFGAKGELREAVTEYRVLAQGGITPNPSPRFAKASPGEYIKRGAEQENSKFSYLEIKPKTGRTHQIRVHMKAVGHPVVCDKLYGRGRVCDGSEECLGFLRLALHALSISLELPNGQFIKIESELPDEFERAKRSITSPTAS